MRRRKIKGKEGLESSKTGAKTDIAMIISMAKEATTFSVGNNKACSNGRGREDEYDNSEGTRTRNGNASKKGPLCYGSG